MKLSLIVPLGAFVSLCGTGSLEPQAPSQPPIPSGLDEQIAFALRSNPDVLLAEAKVRQAQAELNAARLKVTQQVLAGYFERQKQEQLLQHMEVKLDAVMQKVRSGVASTEEAEEARIALTGAKVALEQSVAQQRYLLGVGSLPGLAPPAETREAPPASAAKRPEIPERFRARLDADVALDGGDGEPKQLREVLQALKESSGVAFVLDQSVEGIDSGVRPLQERVPLRSLLLAISDQVDGLCFVVRDYGILTTTKERAWTVSGATIPPEVPYHGSERVGQ